MMDLDTLFKQNEEFILGLAKKNGNHLPDKTLTMDSNDSWMTDNLKWSQEDDFDETTNLVTE